MADKRKRAMQIKMKRKRRAKKKIADGFKKVIEHRKGRRKVRFVKPTE